MPKIRKLTPKYHGQPTWTTQTSVSAAKVRRQATTAQDDNRHHTRHTPPAQNLTHAISNHQAGQTATIRGRRTRDMTPTKTLTTIDRATISRRHNRIRVLHLRRRLPILSWCCSLRRALDLQQLRRRGKAIIIKRRHIRSLLSLTGEIPRNSSVWR